MIPIEKQQNQGVAKFIAPRFTAFCAWVRCFDRSRCLDSMAASSLTLHGIVSTVHSTLVDHLWPSTTIIAFAGAALWVAVAVVACSFAIAYARGWRQQETERRDVRRKRTFVQPLSTTHFCRPVKNASPKLPSLPWTSVPRFPPGRRRRMVPLVSVYETIIDLGPVRKIVD